MMKSTTPLRYPGGKQKIAGYLKQLIKLNNLEDGIYAEPYMGGAGLAFELLFSEHIYNLYLNDADTNIYNFWYSILNDTDRFIEKIRTTDINVKTWRIQKEILFSKSEEHASFDKGFAVFYLNRTNRSGILKAGPIGGYKQDGNWKIDARFNKENLITKIKQISYYKNRIKLYNLDALDFLSEIKPQIINKKALVYLDPPYYHKGQELYLNSYTHEDHKKVAFYMNTEYKDMKWLISYDDCEEIQKIYSNFKFSKQILNYSAAEHKKGKELFFYSKELKTPDNITYYNNN